MEPKRGDIILYSFSFPFGILCWLFSPHFDHVAICTDPGTNQAISAQGFIGVASQYARGSDATYIDMQGKWDAEKVIAWAESLKGKAGYDWGAYLRVPFRLKTRTFKNRFTCSGLVGLALSLFGNHPELGFRECLPDDIARALASHPI